MLEHGKVVSIAICVVLVLHFAICTRDGVRSKGSQSTKLQSTANPCDNRNILSNASEAAPPALKPAGTGRPLKREELTMTTLPHLWAGALATVRLRRATSAQYGQILAARPATPALKPVPATDNWQSLQRSPHLNIPLALRTSRQTPFITGFAEGIDPAAIQSVVIADIPLNSNNE